MGSRTEGKYVCELCKLSFSSEQELNEHDWSLLHHRQLDKEKGRDAVHRCTLCKEDHFGLLSFTKHIHSEKHTNEATRLKYSESKETSHLSTPIQLTSDSVSGLEQRQTAESLPLPAAHFLPRARYFQSLENPLASAPIDPLMRNAIRRPPHPRAHHRFTPQHRPFIAPQRSNFRPRFPTNNQFRYRGQNFSPNYQNHSSNSINTNNSFNNSISNNFNHTSPSMMVDLSFSGNSDSAVSDRDNRSHISSYPRATVQLQSNAKVQHSSVDSNKHSTKNICSSSISRLNGTPASVSSSRSGTTNSVNEMINNVMSTTPIIPLTDEVSNNQLERHKFPMPDEEEVCSSHVTLQSKKQKLEHSRKYESRLKSKKRGSIGKKSQQENSGLNDSSMNSTGDDISFSQSPAVTRRLNKNKKNLSTRNKTHANLGHQRAKRNRNMNASADNLNLNVQFVLKKGREIVKRYSKTANKSSMNNKKPVSKLDHKKIMKLRGIAGYDDVELNSEKQQKTSYDEGDEMELVVPCISNVHSIAASKDLDVSSNEKFTALIGEQEALHDALLLQQVKPVRVELSSLSPSAYAVSSRSPKKVQFIQGKTFDPTLLISGRERADISTKDVSESINSENVTVEKTVLSFSLGSENSSLVPSPRASTPSLPKDTMQMEACPDQPSDESSTRKRRKKKPRSSKQDDNIQKIGTKQSEKPVGSSKQQVGSQMEASNIVCPRAVESAQSNTLLSTTLGDVEDIEEDIEPYNDREDYRSTGQTSASHEEGAAVQNQESTNANIVPEPSHMNADLVGVTNERRIETASKVKQRFRRTSINCNFNNLSAVTDEGSSAIQNDDNDNVGQRASSLRRSLSESDAIDTTEDVESLCDVIIIDYDSEDELQSEESVDPDGFVPMECKPEDCKTEEAKPDTEHYCEFKKKDETYCHNITENRFCDYHRRVVKAVELFVSKKMAAGSSQADAVSLIDVDESEFEAVSCRRRSSTQDDNTGVNTLDKGQDSSRPTRKKSQSACLPDEADNLASAPQASTSVPKISKARKQARFKYLRSLTTTHNNEVHKSNLPPTVRKLLDKKSSGHAIGPNVPAIASQSESENDSNPTDKSSKSTEKRLPKGLKKQSKPHEISENSEQCSEKSCPEIPIHSPDMGRMEDRSVCQSLTTEVMNNQDNDNDETMASLAPLPLVTAITTTSTAQLTHISRNSEDSEEYEITGTTPMTISAKVDNIATKTAEEINAPVTATSQCTMVCTPVLADTSTVEIDNQLSTEPPCISLENPVVDEGSTDVVHASEETFSIPNPPVLSNLVDCCEKVDDSISFNIEPLPSITGEENIESVVNEEAFVTCDDIHFHSVSESGMSNNGNIDDAQHADSTLETFKSFDYEDESGSDDNRGSEVLEALPGVGDSLLHEATNETNIDTDETLVVDLENEMDKLITDEEESLDKLLQANTALEQLRAEMSRVQSEICLHASHMQTITARKKTLYQKLRECRKQKSGSCTRMDGSSLSDCSPGASGDTSVFAVCAAGYSSSDDSVPLSILRKQRTLLKTSSKSLVPVDNVNSDNANVNMDIAHSSTASDEDFSCELGSVYDTPPGSLKSEKSGTKRPNSSNDESVRSEEALSPSKDCSSRTLRSRTKRNKNVK